MVNPFKQQGAFSWCELMTTDTAAAKNFYQQIFGWELRDQPIDGMTYTVIKAGDSDVGGLMAKPPDAPDMPTSWGIYVTVDDVDATAEQVKALGGQVMMSPTDIPDVGRFALIQDPQGAVLSIITYLPMSDSPD
ncbi:MAG: VOC family protein [Leptolyngbya sp. SIO4C1]|nr:VOC family protein [Leptolyngbya sp. SIO4C1]